MPELLSSLPVAFFNNARGISRPLALENQSLPIHSDAPIGAPDSAHLANPRHDRQASELSSTLQTTLLESTHVHGQPLAHLEPPIHEISSYVAARVGLGTGIVSAATLITVLARYYVERNLGVSISNHQFMSILGSGVFGMASGGAAGFRGTKDAPHIIHSVRNSRLFTRPEMPPTAISMV